MATLAPELATRLRDAVRAEELRFRKWSGPGDWRFAIYTWDDTFQGCVSMREGKLVIVDGRFRAARKETEILSALCRRFNTLA